MIKIDSETVVSFKKVCKRLPHRRADRPTHPATLYRWAADGLRGDRLETIQVGRALCTPIEALQRFFENLSLAGGQEGTHVAE